MHTCPPIELQRGKKNFYSYKWSFFVSNFATQKTYLLPKKNKAIFWVFINLNIIKMVQERCAVIFIYCFRQNVLNKVVYNK